MPSRLVLLNGDGERFPVTNMWDSRHRETWDRNKVAAVVAELPNGQWLATTCKPDELEYVH